MACMIFVLNLFSATVLAVFKGNNFFGVEFNHVLDNRYFDKDGKSITSTSECLTGKECLMVIDVKYNGSLAPSTFSIKSNNISSFALRYTTDDVDVEKIMFLENRTYSVPVWNGIESCVNESVALTPELTANGTADYKTVCSDAGFETQETRWYW